VESEKDTIIIGTGLEFSNTQIIVVGYSPTTQEVAGSIPAQCKHLCA
jgi:hypothetical protein